MKIAFSGWRISKSHYCLKHRFWPKNALFCTRTTSVGVKIVIFCFEKTLTYPWTRFRLISGRFAPIFSEGRSKVFLAPMKPDSENWVYQKVQLHFCIFVLHFCTFCCTFAFFLLHFFTFCNFSCTFALLGCTFALSCCIFALFVALLHFLFHFCIFCLALFRFCTTRFGHVALLHFRVALLHFRVSFLHFWFALLHFRFSPPPRFDPTNSVFLNRHPQSSKPVFRPVIQSSQAKNKAVIQSSQGPKSEQ